jgi:hypothetical protein
MSSFAELRAARAGRQRGYVPREVEVGHQVEDVTTEGGRSGHGGENTKMASAEGSDIDLTRESEDTSEVDDSGPPTQPSSVRPTPVPASSLPPYSDFPSDLLEVCVSPTSGRGLYIQTGQKITKGPSSTESTHRTPAVLTISYPRPRTNTTGTTFLRTSPLVALLSTPNLHTHCSGCFLSRQELVTLSALQVNARRGNEAITVVPELKACAGCGVVRYCSRVESKSTLHSHPASSS